MTWLDGVKNLLGLGSHVASDTLQVTHLRSKLTEAEHRYAAAAEQHNKTGKMLQLAALSQAEKLTEISEAVRGVVSRLESKESQG